MADISRLKNQVRSSFEMAAINRGRQMNEDIEYATNLIEDHLLDEPDKHKISQITGLDGKISDLDNHLDGGSDKHAMSEITGLSGFTGSIDVVVSVDFTAETTETKTMSFENGLLKTIT